MCLLLGRPLASASVSTAFFQKVAYCYKYCSTNRSLRRPTFGPARCAKRQQVAISAGVVGPLVCKSFYMGMMSVIRALSQSTLENGHAPPRHEGLRWPSSVLVICDPISSLRAFHIWLSLLWFLRSSSNWQHPQESLFRHVSLGAAGWPCLLQAFACWVPSAGPFSCIWRRAWFCSHFIPPKPIQRPFAPSVAFSADAPCFGQLMPWISLQNAVLLPKGRVLPLGPASLGPLVSGAAGRPCLLLAFTCWVPSADPFSCTWSSVQFYLQCFSCCWQLPVYRKVWSPWRPPFWPTLSTARCQLENEQCCWPSIGPLVSGAAGRPCLLQALPCWERPSPLHLETCTVLLTGLQELPATARLPKSLVSPGGHHFGQYSVQRSVSRTMCQCACWWWLFSGVSDVATAYLQSFSPRRHGYATPFDFSEKGLKCCGFGSVRARKPLLQLPLTVWPFGACVGALFQRSRRDVLSPCASGADCRPFSTGRRRTALLAALCAVYSLLQSACRQSKPTLWDFCFCLHFILYVLLSRA